MTDEQKLSFGERAVGLSFNPSEDPQVDAIKRACADIIDIFDEMRQAGSPDVKRMCAIAITELQSAQMWAVKAATWRE